MKILVTGAAGGIGSTLSYHLHSKGHKIILVDNLRNGYLENLKINDESFGKFHQIDINDNAFHELVASELPEIIIHLAAITSLPDCEVNYRECIRINVEGTASVLGAASKCGVRRVIFGSTSAVYEKTKLNASGYTEQDKINPRLYYSLSKKMAEELCMTYRENYGLDVIIFRFFNVFGPRQDIHRQSPPVINYIVREFSRNIPPVLHSDGKQSRDYIHIDDIVSAIEKALILRTDKFIFNLSTNKAITINDIVKYIKKSNQEFNFIDARYQSPNKLWDNYPELFEGKYPLKKQIVEKETLKHSLGNNTSIKNEFDWYPCTDFEKMIEQTAREIQKNIKKLKN